MTTTAVSNNGRARTNWPLVAAIVAFMATRVWLLAWFTPMGSDADFYCQWALNAVDLGQTPYSDDLPIEYPPLGFRVLTLPRVFASDRVAASDVSRETFERLLAEYLPVHRAIMAAFETASFVLLLLIVRRRRPELVASCAWGYVAMTFCLAHLLIERMDAGLLFIVMLWAWSWTVEAESRWAKFWHLASWAALGLGVAYKLVPAVMVPVLFAWKLRDNWREATIAVLVFGLFAVTPFAFEYTQAGWGVLDIFKYHGERGIQLESIYASALMALRPLGLTMFVEKSHRSLELVAAASWSLAKLSTWLIVAIVGATSLYAASNRFRGDRLEAYRIALWTLAAATAVSKVLSPQFFIWELPVLLLLGVEVCRGREFAIFASVLVVMAALTTAIYPYFYLPHMSWSGGPNAFTLSELHPVACTMLIVRNGFLVAVVAFTGVRLFRAPNTTTTNPKTND